MTQQPEMITIKISMAEYADLHAASRLLTGTGTILHAVNPTGAKFAKDIGATLFDLSVRASVAWATNRAFKENEWCEWTGGPCPVTPGTRRVDIKFRDSVILENTPAGAFGWSHIGMTTDIIAYRIHTKNGDHE